jgi:UDP-N-acetylmuramoyl-tripeptide--D-alanyl-D-alanine ligase
VLGEMLELGDEAPSALWGIGQEAGALGVDFVIAAGQDLAKQLPLGAAGVDAAIVGDNQTATELLDKMLRPGDVVIIKGRGAACGGRLPKP